MSLVGFPLLLIPLAIVNIIVFLMPGVSFAATLATVPLMSGAVWKATLGDALLALSLLLVLFEVIKASRPNGRYLTDHLLSLLTLAATVAEFVLLPQFATSVFFLLAVMMAVDFIAGVSLRLRREAIAAGRTSVKSSSVRATPARPIAGPLPPTEPAPVPPVPAPVAVEPAAVAPEPAAVVAPVTSSAATAPVAFERPQTPSVVAGPSPHDADEAPTAPAASPVPDQSVR